MIRMRINQFIRFRKTRFPDEPLYFDNMIFKNCDFSRLDLNNAMFENCILSKCRFDKADLTNAKFINTDISHCTFKDVDMSALQIITGALHENKLELFEDVMESLKDDMPKIPSLKGIISQEPNPLAAVTPDSRLFEGQPEIFTFEP